MTKTQKMLAALVLAATATGCSGTGNTGSSTAAGTAPETQPQSETASAAIINDNAVGPIQFEAPESFDQVERYSETTADGKLVEKDIQFKADDKDVVGYSFSNDVLISEVLDLDELEKEEISGKTVYFLERSGYSLGFTETDGSTFAIDSEVDMKNVKDAFAKVNFTDTKDTILDDTDIEGIQYTFDESLNLLGTSVRLAEDAEGNFVKKTVNYTFGEDEENKTCIFQFIKFKDKKIEDVTNPDRTYTDTEINGIKYSSYGSEGDPPFVYYSQQGDDVYMIQNSGISNGWTTDRSEESFELFEKLLNTVSFQ